MDDDENKNLLRFMHQAPDIETVYDITEDEFLHMFVGEPANDNNEPTE